MSNEPGLTLGRLVAAERNASTGMELANQLAQSVAALSVQVEKTNARLAQAEALIAALNGRMASMIGTGATQR